MAESSLLWTTLHGISGMFRWMIRRLVTRFHKVSNTRGCVLKRWNLADGSCATIMPASSQYRLFWDASFMYNDFYCTHATVLFIWWELVFYQENASVLKRPQIANWLVYGSSRLLLAAEQTYCGMHKLRYDARIFHRNTIEPFAFLSIITQWICLDGDVNIIHNNLASDWLSAHPPAS